MTSTKRHTSTELNVSLNQDDAGLQRLIGLVRRRGFSVTAMEAQQEPTGVMRVRIRVTGYRPLDVLIKQIETLIDVRTVGLEPARRNAVA